MNQEELENNIKTYLENNGIKILKITTIDFGLPEMKIFVDIESNDNISLGKKFINSLLLCNFEELQITENGEYILVISDVIM